MWPVVLFAQMAAAQPPDRPVDVEPPRERHNILVGNALGILLGRLGFDFGRFVAPHVAPTASVHFQATVMLEKEKFIGAGGEIGVRLYGGAHRPTGPFIGLYAVGGRYEAESSARDSSIVSYGGAGDIGWSFCSSKNVVVALGFGAEIRGAQESGNLLRGGRTTAVFFEPGIHPRGLVQIGSFF